MTDERDGTLGEVIDQRVQVYGNPVETFARIAEVWSGILGHPVNATDVPLCLIGMKIVRTTQAPDYSDNSDDIEGYLDIFRQLVGPDMIQARSVTEYVDKKLLTLQREAYGAGPDMVDEERPHMGAYSEDEPIPYVLRDEALIKESPVHYIGCNLSEDHAGTCCTCTPGSATCKIGCPSRRD